MAHARYPGRRENNNVQITFAQAPQSLAMQHAVQDYIVADSEHHHNEITSKQLDRYHSMLNSFNLQATLIVGFALSSINHDNMNCILNAESRYCIYKTPVWGIMFVSSIVVCVSTMLTCIGGAFYIELRTQSYALHVGVSHSVSMVKIWMAVIVKLYVFGMLAFVTAISAAALAGRTHQHARPCPMARAPSHGRRCSHTHVCLDSLIGSQSATSGCLRWSNTRPWTTSTGR